MCIRDRGCRPAQRCRRGSGPRDPAGLGRRTPRCGLRPFRRVRRCPAGRGGGARDGRQACARLAGDSRGRGLPRPAGSRSTGRPSAGWAPHRDHVGALRGGRGASDPAPAVERLRLAPHPTAPRASRDFVTRTLLDWGLGRAISSASLVVSELVTNSTTQWWRTFTPLRWGSGGVRSDRLRDVGVFWSACESRKCLLYWENLTTTGALPSDWTRPRWPRRRVVPSPP